MCVNYFSLLSARMARVISGSLLVGSVSLGCATAAHGFRINPEQEPEQYRVSCKKRFYYCELEAEELCEGEYTELGRLSNLPELPLVKDADVSSTGPGVGVQYWVGELTVQCGRELPNLPLVRQDVSPGAQTLVTPAPAALAPVSLPPAVARVCVPGATQECLGPGACKGAQACLEAGQGYGPCDCGTGPSSPSPAPNAEASSPPGVAESKAPPLVSTPPSAATPPAVSNQPAPLGR